MIGQTTTDVALLLALLLGPPALVLLVPTPRPCRQSRPCPRGRHRRRPQVVTR
ncbi:MAG: hypothetical protein ABR608_16200 [Pseudonocardiaceae bacterium]